MDVDDPGERRPSLISVKGSSSEDREMMNTDAHLRGCQEKRDHLQNLCIALRSVEPWGVDEGHRSPVEGEFFGELDLGSPRCNP